MPTWQVGFPGGSDCKESTCNVGDLGLISGLERSPGGGNGNPLQYSCLENPHGHSTMGSQRVRHDRVTKYRIYLQNSKDCLKKSKKYQIIERFHGASFIAPFPCCEREYGLGQTTWRVVGHWSPHREHWSIEALRRIRVTSVRHGLLA